MAGRSRLTLQVTRTSSSIATALGPFVSRPVHAAYASCAAVAIVIICFVAGGEFSCILTVSALVQSLSIIFLCMQVLFTKSVSSISAKSVAIDALSCAFRLSSTTHKLGYLPADPSGDHVYQTIDACSLVMLFWLLYRILVVHADAYVMNEDGMRVITMCLACPCLAAAFHADANASPFYDTLWMTGLFYGAVSILPQLWLLNKKGEQPEELISHYLTTVAVSRLLSGIFFWSALSGIFCIPWVAGLNHAVVALLGAYVVNFVHILDFVAQYGSCLFQNALLEPLNVSMPGLCVDFFLVIICA
eukprot:CAMPEP_0117464876 /NCGR_PEP_ID=MMETSP0784-20121206/4334_1 /TAXON_ID=39447 /ORGANISM="" /LENGTH=302 /DNA_ID=CAMNT_0005258763 /DNA_START=91 /DNA_END=999 /DNA_ORIENTATION=+